jgi:hypothetical protein
VILPENAFDGDDVLADAPTLAERASLKGFIARRQVGTRTSSRATALREARGDIDGADMLIYGACRIHRWTHAMMYLDTPPRLIGTEVFSAMPEIFKRKGVLQ